ncbi:TIGR03862 family flavoprotein [Agrobacterium sp. fls2-241-TYG-188a]|uniref:TIGR03862 family flavoprotein n=1 Tax=Agrobacterium sp. fls2-241-TYG-188a TaxID=3040275 RepID=UPI00254ED261|nr:TIGR03862 family flavoprotein [Agrobacterium sp. fls2-241-TYG-188a]
MDGRQVTIIGGGPAGLMAAEVLSSAGAMVTVFEAMPTVARKFLMAGKSGLNITHAEDYSAFVSRFGSAQTRLRSALDDFTPQMLRDWALELGQETFVGTSNRVFPVAMKASPLLRTWLSRLERQGVTIKTRHRWVGFEGDALAFETPDGRIVVESDLILIALGGASWPRLGSDGAWVPWLKAAGAEVVDFQPANCGFNVGWSDYFRDRFAGTPIKSVALTSGEERFEGEFVISTHGIEGSLVYAHSASVRDALKSGKGSTLLVDLAPGRTQDRIANDLERHPRKDSLSNRLRKAASLSPAKIALLRECHPDLADMSFQQLAAAIKASTIPVTSPRPIAEAISSAGGVGWCDIDDHFMLKSRPGIFVAGEMLDWEAPTGGYLLTACFATGKAAANGLLHWRNRTY